MKRSKLKKRLRKKYHVGEYTQLGFYVVITLSDEAKQTQESVLNTIDLIYDRLQTLYPDMTEIALGGSLVDGILDGSIGKVKGSFEVDEAEVLINSLRVMKEIKSIERVSKLIDMWNGPWDDIKKEE